MNKRKLLTLAMTLCMVAILAIGGTLAYFTDTDSDKNVMLVGNIDIEQVETLDEDMTMYPTADDEEDGLNHVTKEVKVKNNGALDAYVRTIFAFEDTKTGEYTSQLHTGWNMAINGAADKYEELYATNASTDADVVWMQNADGSWMTVEVDGVTYTIAVVTYPNPVKAGEESPLSMVENWLDDKATNESFYAKVGKEYNILVLSQAAQVGDWTDAETALDTAFGDITEAKLAEWF